MIPQADKSEVRAAWIWSALVALACAAAYAGTLRNDFVFDDIAIVRDNPRLKSWGEAPGLLMSDYWESQTETDKLWRPVTMLSYLLNARLVSDNAWAFHLGNLLAHAAVAVVVLMVGRMIGLGRAGAAAAGLAFGLHPIHTDAVASVVGRAELLAALFYLLALACWLRGLGRGVAWRGGVWFVPAAACFFLALGSKENAATFPLIAGLACVFFTGRAGGEQVHASATGGDKNQTSTRGGGESHRARRLIIGGAALAAALGVYLAARYAVLGALRFDPPREIPGLLFGAPLAERWLTASAVFARYAGLMLWPARLSADYSFDAIPVVRSLADPYAAAGILIIISLIVGVIALRKRSPAAAFGLAFFIAAFVLTSNFVLPIKTIMAERLTYLPSAGLAWAFGAWLDSTLSSASAEGGAGGGRGAARWAKAATLFAVAVILAGWAGRIITRNRDWRSNETLFTATVAAQPQCAKAHYNLADVYRVDHGDWPAAAVEYSLSLAIDPGDVAAWINLGVCHYKMEDFEAAVAAFETAAGLDPLNATYAAYVEGARQRLGPVFEATPAVQ